MLGQPSDLSYCWPRYLTNFTFASGVLHVNLQVDRESPEGQAQGEAAAKAIANIMGAAYDEPISERASTGFEGEMARNSHLAKPGSRQLDQAVLAALHGILQQ